MNKATELSYKKKEEYKLSPNKYRELKYFCLQYKEKKDKLKNISYISAVTQSGMPQGTGTSDPTASLGDEIVQLKKEIELIEQTAIATDSEFYECILENVTKNVPWEYLDMPLSRRSFYYRRRKYFYLLSQKK